MCGIVGYIGTKKASPILINGLLRLEYRGYDSAGISTVEKNGLSIMKDKGRVLNLTKLKGIDDLEGTVGIAHTRWATHGKPSPENSHPHQDNSKTFSVVHNGIIENYHELKKFLTDKGYTFYSQTDTEIIPNLIHYYYTKDKQDDSLKFLRAVRNACFDLKGSFALEILCKDYPDNMIVVRKDSPLVIGKGMGENYISSDIPAILSFTKDFYLLNDLEFVLLSRNEVKFYNKDLEPIDKKSKVIEWNASSAEKEGYEDFMLKEIYEQPTAIRETIGAKFSENSKCEFENLNFSKEYLSSLNKIYIVACGTAMHAGLIAKYLFEQYTNTKCEVFLASEYRYQNNFLNNKVLSIFISQSGETADTLAALKKVKEENCDSLGIVNVKESSIARVIDKVLYTEAGTEIAVASTKAYTAQVALLSVLVLAHAYRTKSIKEEKILNILEEFRSITSILNPILEDTKTYENIAKEIYEKNDVFYIGRGLDYALAMEGSLKLKEISYIHSEAYAAGELKHGTISLITKDTPVFSSATNKHINTKTISNLKEVISRGAKCYLITDEDIKDDNIKVIKIKKVSMFLKPLLTIIPYQLIAYYTAKLKGCDIDKPRNLAKSVTVE